MRNLILFVLFLLLLGGVTAIATSPPANAGQDQQTFLPLIVNPEDTPTPSPTATSVPPTEVPPTATPAPPTPTATPLPWCTAVSNGSPQVEPGLPMYKNWIRPQMTNGAPPPAVWIRILDEDGNTQDAFGSYLEVDIRFAPFTAGEVVKVYAGTTTYPLSFCGDMLLVNYWE